MKKTKEIVRLRLGASASVREIAAACGVGHSTVHEYLRRMEAAGLRWPEADELSEDELHGLLFPLAKQAGVSRPVPDWNEVRRELGRKGVTLKLLWEEYISREPNGYSYSLYAKRYRAWLKAGDLVMLQRHVPGERLFVDWAGVKLRIADSQTGEVSEASVFVSAMGASQYIFAKVYASESSPNWLAAHVDAFEFYGALPSVIVPDNLKTGIVKPCRYEPETNLAYAELARHYELAVLPARVRKPKDKAKVENAVQQVERWALAPLRDRTFFTLAEANRALADELGKINAKRMKGPGLSRKELFEQEDRPAMRPLPESPYTYAEWKRAKLGPDYHVEVDGHRYSVPYRLVSEQIDVRSSHRTIEVFHKGVRVASHKRTFLRRGFTTLEEHMPEKHKKQGAWTPERFLAWSGKVGPGAADFTERLLASKVHPEHAYRTLLGVLNLEKQFGSERLNSACGKAASLEALSYRSVKSILEHRLEGASSKPELPALPKHENVRGSAFYAQGGELCAN